MNKYSGGNFDDFLKEEGIFEEVLECTRKRLLALQIEDCINTANPKKVGFTDYQMSTGLMQLNYHLFDPDNTAITSELLNRLTLGAKEMNVNPMQLNSHLFDLEELLSRFLPKEVEA